MYSDKLIYKQFFNCLLTFLGNYSPFFIKSNYFKFISKYDMPILRVIQKKLILLLISATFNN